MKQVIVLVLFGAGVILSVAGLLKYGLACVSAGLFVEAL